MNCANCGTQYEEGAKFCKHCGFTFEAEAVKVKPLPKVLQIFEFITGEDLNHDRVNSMIRQILGLIVIMVTIFAVVKKPSPGIFMIYAVPSILAGVVIVLERRASVGKALFTLAMIIPYLTIFLLGIPPIMAASASETMKAANGLTLFFGSITTSVLFIMMGFLFTIFSSIVSMFFNKRLSIISGAIALVLSIIFASSFMALLGNPSVAVSQSVSIDDKLLSTVKIITTANMPAEDGTIDAAKDFMSNEIIYPYVSGLPVGTSFGFRLLDAKGQVMSEFDRSNTFKSKALGKKSPAGAFNTVEERLTPGSYKLELLVTDGWKTYISGRANFTMSAEINPNYGVITDDSYAWLSTIASGTSNTSFKQADEIHLVLDGAKLQSEVTILMKDETDKITFDKDYSAMPIGKSDYMLAPKASDLGTGKFTAVITSDGKEPITIYFTIE